MGHRGEGQHVVSTAMIPPHLTEPPPPPAPPGGEPDPCYAADTCTMSPRCEHYGSCELAEARREVDQ